MRLRQVIGSAMSLIFSVCAPAAGYDWVNGDYTNVTTITGSPGVGGDGSNLGVFANQGTITSPGAAGFWLLDDAVEISNTGTITTSAASYYSGINLDGTTIGTFTLATLNNSGTISSLGSFGYGIYNAKVRIGTLINDGTISGTYIGVVNTSNATIDSFENRPSGMIIGGIHNSAGSTIGALTNNNSGVIVGAPYGIDNQGSIGAVSNAGYIGTTDGVAADSQYGINNLGIITDLDNTSSGVIMGSDAAINNETGATITNLTNSATITTATGGTAIANNADASIDVLTNSGRIGTSDGVASDSFRGIVNLGSIGQVNNTISGVIRGSNDGIQNGGRIDSLANAGLIIGDGYGGITSNNYIGIFTNTGSISGATVGFANWGEVASLSNSGDIRGGYSGVVFVDPSVVGETLNSGILVGAFSGIQNEGGSVNLLFNTGKIGTTNGGTAESQYGIYNTGTITELNNAGTGVTMGSFAAIYNDGAIGVLSNSGKIGTLDGTNALAESGIWNLGQISQLTNTRSGVIAGINYGIKNDTTGNLSTITNYGTITGGGAGIVNYGNILFLNNAQGSGNIAGPLTYQGELPTTYSIILGRNASTYGQLSYLGGGSSTTLANFGIYAGSIYSKKYAGVLSGITDVTNGKTGTYSGQTYQLVQNGSSDIWDLLFPNWYAGPNAANTLQSVQQMASGLSSVYNQQAAAYQAALSYDCQLYDTNNLCVSVGGRYTYAGPSPSANQQAGLVILGYKPVPTFRLGAFADQSVNNTTPSGITQSKSSPMWGLFAKWHMNKDETGLGVQASAVTSASKLTTTRTQLENTEAGSGSTQFNGQGYQLTTNYHQPVTDNTSVVPYLGLRYTRINAGAYTENTTATVTSPLSYNAMAQNTFSAIGGIGVRSHLAEKLTGTASVGIQQNLNYSMGNYAGTSNITALESFSVQMPGNVNSMATASAGLYYDVRKNERVGLNVLWQQQPFIATNTTTALATYTIGF